MDDELRAFVEGAQEEDVESVEEEGKKKKKKSARKKKEPKEPKPKRDNIAYLKSLESISAVRKFHQTALAKKAKSLDRPEAVARYDREIEESAKFLKEMLEEAYNSQDPLHTLLDKDEEPNKILTFYIEKKESEFNDWVEMNSYKVPKSALKNVSEDIPQNFLEELPLDLHEPLEARYSKSDFRLKALCRKFNFLTEAEAGRLVYNQGKWLSKEESFQSESAQVEE